MSTAILSDQQRPRRSCSASSTRPHWSYSQVSQFLRCPLQYWFERIQKLERPFVPSAMALGSSVHSALEAYHRHLQLEEPIPEHSVQQAFLDAWSLNEQRQPIQFKEKETKEEILAQGVGLLELYLQEPPPQNIVAVEESLLVPLFTSTGECLEKPLLAVLDLLSRDDHGLVVSEYKTSARRYSELEADMLLQATSYVHAVQEAFDERAGVRYVVLVKTKKPQVQILETVRGDSDIRRLGDVVQAVERAIDAGAFYPNESVMNCSGCGFYRHCREWKGCSSNQQLQQLEVATC